MSQKERGSVDGRIERLERLAELRAKGALSEDEFNAEKVKALADHFPSLCSLVDAGSIASESDHGGNIDQKRKATGIIVALVIAGLLLASFWAWQGKPLIDGSQSKPVAIAPERQRPMQDADSVEWEPVSKCRGGHGRIYRCDTQMRPKAITWH